VLEFHGIDFIDLQRSPIFEDRQNDRETDRSFRRRNYHHEERIDVAVNPAQN
jgi:hypothetical protein